MMPVPGRDAAKALELAEKILASEFQSGTILFITDEIRQADLPVFQKHSSQSRNAVLLLALGTEQGGSIPSDSVSSGFHNLDIKAIKKFSAQADISVRTVTVDDTDIQWLNRHIQRQLAQAQNTDETMQWQDAGYWLTFPIAMIILFWFRRGWLVQWS